MFRERNNKSGGLQTATTENRNLVIWRQSRNQNGRRRVSAPSGARFALIFGADELAQGQVALKPLRGERAAAAAQLTLSLADPAAIVARLRAD